MLCLLQKLAGSRPIQDYPALHISISYIAGYQVSQPWHNISEMGGSLHLRLWALQSCFQHQYMLKSHCYSCRVYLPFFPSAFENVDMFHGGERTRYDDVFDNSSLITLLSAQPSKRYTIVSMSLLLVP